MELQLYIESIQREIKQNLQKIRDDPYYILANSNNITKQEYFDLVSMKILFVKKDAYIQPFSPVILKEKIKTDKMLLAFFLGFQQHNASIAVQNAKILLENFPEKIYMQEADLTFLLYIQQDILLKLQDGKMGRLQQLLNGNLYINYNIQHEFTSSNFNSAQAEAITKILNLDKDNFITLVHGPPGTGKTYVISECIRMLLENQNSVLLVSHTNVAVDNALEKIYKSIQLHKENANSKILRLGNPIVSDSEIIQKLYVTDIPKFTELKGKVLGMTLSKLSIIISSKDFDYNEPIIDYIFIDEASMANLPLTLIGMVVSKYIVLLGDPHQLPPIITDEEATPEIKTSLFEKLLKVYPQAVTFLNIQYRSHPAIANFASKLFYEGNLQSAESTQNKKIVLNDPHPHPLYAAENRVVWLNSSNGKMEWQKLGKGYSAYNLYEVALVGCILNYYRDQGFDIGKDIKIITPFRLQAQIIDSMIQDELQINIDIEELDTFPNATTIDRIQGREISILLISLVDNGGNWKVHKILQDYRRLNVALTRSKNKVIIIGSTMMATHDLAADFIRSLFNYSKNYQTYIDSFKDCNLQQLQAVATVALHTVVRR